MPSSTDAPARRVRVAYVLLLGFDTSTPAVTAATSAGAARTVVAANRHGELLAPLVAEVLGGAPPDAIVVGLGPGPFTGLRVGVMTAKSMGHALGIPVYGACSLDALATPGGAVATDARRREVYWARYDASGARVDGPHVAKPHDAAAALREAGVTYVAGAGPRLYPEAFAGFEAGPEHPDAVRLLDAPRLPDLAPLYLRRPDATPPGPRKKVTA